MVCRIDERDAAAGSPGWRVAQPTLAGRGLSPVEGWSENDTAQATGLFAAEEGGRLAREPLAGSPFWFTFGAGEEDGGRVRDGLRGSP